jgi:hypothetical protein
VIGKPEDVRRRDPDQDGAHRGNRQERGCDPGRDREEDDGRAADDPDEVRERTPRPVSGARGDQADSYGAGAAHDRQRGEQERCERFPANRREGKRLKHRRRYTFEPCPRR